MSPQPEIAADWLATRMADSSGRGMVQAMTALVHDGTLPAGTRLPTVRAMAQAKHVSQGTIASVWNELRRRGYVETRRRGGSFVSYPVTRDERDADGFHGLNLASTETDPQFQPSLESALLQGLKVHSLHNPRPQHIIEPLQEAVAPTWPFQPQAWTTAGGVSEGMLLAVLAAGGVGGYFAVETPTNPRTVKMLQTLGTRVFPIAWDDEGPRPEDLARALAAGVTAFLYQPRMHYPLSRSVTPTRMTTLAGVLTAHAEVLVIEDDGYGPLAGNSSASLGRLLADRVLLNRAYCKAFGTDLRVSVMGGPTAIIDKVRSSRSYGTAMTSRILQGTIAALLESRSTQSLIARARARYAQRRERLITGLRREGMNLATGEGHSIWLFAGDGPAASVRLSAAGILVAPGSNCSLIGDSQHICMSTTRLPDDQRDADRLARRIVEAVREDSIEEYA